MSNPLLLRGIEDVIVCYNNTHKKMREIAVEPLLSSLERERATDRETDRKGEERERGREEREKRGNERARQRERESKRESIAPPNMLPL